MSSNRRIYQIAERVKEVIATEIVTASDPRFSMVTITSAVVSPDLRIAKIYWVVSILDPSTKKERIAEVQEALQSAAGFLRKFIAKSLNTRFVPELKFYYDDTFDTMDEVETLLKRVRTNEQ